MSGYRHRDHKWNDLMLPEHKDRLAALRSSLGREAPPELDDQERERIGAIVEEACQSGQSIRIRYFQDGRRCEASGRIRRRTAIAIVLTTTAGREVHLPLAGLIQAELLD